MDTNSDQQEHDRTLTAVRRVVREPKLLAHEPDLRKDWERRAPYLDSLSYLQVELLGRRRTLDAEQDASTLDVAIYLTINGIAAGLRNTG